MAKEDTEDWKSTLDAHPEHLQAIGLISVEISNLEMRLADVFAEVSSAKPTVAQAIYFAPRAAMLRVDMLIAATKAAMALKEEEFRQDDLLQTMILGARAKRLIERRNDIMHGSWSVVLETKEVYLERAQGSQRREGGKPVRIQDLRRLVRDIRILIDQVRYLLGWRDRHE
jgi:hypothetical protein